MLDRRSTRWEDHRQARRAQLLKAARRAIHHEGPDLSMEQIAVAAGTTKSIFYRYFTDKQGLQSAIGQEVIEALRDSFANLLDSYHSEPVEESVRNLVEIYIEMLQSSPNVYRFVTQASGTTQSSGPSGPQVDDFIQQLTDMIAGALRLILVQNDQPAQLGKIWAAAMVGFMRDGANAWLRGSDEITSEHMIDTMSTWLWSGLSVYTSQRSSNERN